MPRIIKTLIAADFEDELIRFAWTLVSQEIYNGYYFIINNCIQLQDYKQACVNTYIAKFGKLPATRDQPFYVFGLTETSSSAERELVLEGKSREFYFNGFTSLVNHPDFTYAVFTSIFFERYHAGDVYQLMVDRFPELLPQLKYRTLEVYDKGGSRFKFALFRGLNCQIGLATLMLEFGTDDPNYTRSVEAFNTLMNGGSQITNDILLSVIALYQDLQRYEDIDDRCNFLEALFLVILPLSPLIINEVNTTLLAEIKRINEGESVDEAEDQEILTKFLNKYD